MNGTLTQDTQEPAHAPRSAPVAVRITQPNAHVAELAHHMAAVADSVCGALDTVIASGNSDGPTLVAVQALVGRMGLAADAIHTLHGGLEARSPLAWVIEGTTLQAAFAAVWPPSARHTLARQHEGTGAGFSGASRAGKSVTPASTDGNGAPPLAESIAALAAYLQGVALSAGAVFGDLIAQGSDSADMLVALRMQLFRVALFAQVIDAAHGCQPTTAPMDWLIEYAAPRAALEALWPSAEAGFPAFATLGAGCVSMSLEG